MAIVNKTFRIFVSSTFSDMKEERNALQKYVFPKLRELCMQHSYRFQVIDLKWGVREESSQITISRFISDIKNRMNLLYLHTCKELVNNLETYERN